MLIVGLTGNSGSGKGYLCSLIASDDICIIDTDRVYHEMIQGPSKCTDALVSAFGEAVLNDEGGINRAELGKIVFSDKDKLDGLNRITHRYILDECRRIIDISRKKIAVIDAPVLFESDFYKECDVTVGVVADVETRIKRIIERDSISREKAVLRINSQRHDDWFRLRCDYIIENNGKDIEAQAKLLVSELMRLYGEKEKKK